MLWWVNGVSKRRVRYGGDREFNTCTLSDMWNFLLSLKVAIKFLSGRGGRVKGRLVKNKTTTIVEKSFKTLNFSIGTVRPDNLTIVKGRKGLEVEQKKRFWKKP